VKVVVIGGSGLIGNKLVTRVREHGHEVVPASPASGVNTITGEGLASALAGTQVVVDVSNSPSFETSAALEFFTTSTRNLLDAEAAAGVTHHVALSVVGTQRLSESGYFRAKMAQEEMIKDSSISYSILHATQFFEFINSIADSATDGAMVRLPPILVQPVAADDVADALCEVALGAPVNGTIEVAGPQQYRLDELTEDALRAHHDVRGVSADPTARYFGVTLDERALLPDSDARITKTHLKDWQTRSAGAR
jgi:uncharacterized protein YbjT (DUF2867 family)